MPRSPTWRGCGLQTISFFLVVFLVCSWVVRWHLELGPKRFPLASVPHFSPSGWLVALWGLLFLLILTMISGARELMTPGAWKKEGFTYKLKDDDEPAKAVVIEREAERRAALDRLRPPSGRTPGTTTDAFPPGDSPPEIPEEAWRVPDPSAMKYRYTPGLTADQGSVPLAYEPGIFGTESARALDQRQDRVHDRETSCLSAIGKAPLMRRFVLAIAH